MTNRRSIFILMAIALPALVQAQARPDAQMPDSSQMAALMASSLKRSKPAEYVLDFTQQLALTAEQVSFLEVLAVAQRDSQGVRMQRMREQSRAQIENGKTSAAVASFAWAGSIDEKAIRDQACAQSALTVESTLALIRDRHAVGAILTPEQLARLPQLEMQAMMKALQRP